MATINLTALIEHLNPECQKSLEAAAGLCLSRTHYTVELEHWFIKLLDNVDNDFAMILKEYNIDSARLISDLMRNLETVNTGNDKAPTLSKNIIDLGREAWLNASLDYGAIKIRSAHLLCALLQDQQLSQIASQLSKEFSKIPVDDFLAKCTKLMAKSGENDLAVGEKDVPSMDTTGAPSKMVALDKYTQDLTKEARDGKIDPVLGRENEVRQMIDILTRRRQNNPILTGEAGVGKTAVVEGFALRIVEGDVPPALENVSLRTLDLGLLQAGAGVKGEFENRLKSVISEVKSSAQPIILFIDEAHTLIGAGGAAGQGDAANLLKPALARGELRTIAATTWAEYKKYFEKDPALTRRFQVVKVQEPVEKDAIDMMRSLRSVLEAHHKVKILDEAIVDSVKLSARYISGRQLPDKSVSLLDTACARVAVSQSSTPSSIEATQQKIARIDTALASFKEEMSYGVNHAETFEQLTQEKEELKGHLQRLMKQWKKEKNFIAKLKEIRESLVKADADTISTLQDEYSQLSQELVSIQDKRPLMQSCVDSQVIAEVVASWTGIPVGKMLSDEIKTTLTIKEQLEKRIIGQPQALEAVAQSIKTSRAKLTDPRKPIGVFFFAGTSGVGKTETALALAELLYGDEKNITTINMSEFKEEHKVSLLAGSPPGYVGYGEGGVLTEAVRRKPYSIILLDEMEKAHSGIQDVFYQVFDKGMMRDGEGRDIDFRNTIIIMTSNVGTDLITQLCADPTTAPDAEGLRQALEPELLKTFKPAFLGRVKVVPYFPLNEEDISSIVRLQLARIQRRISEHYHATMTFDESLVGHIASRCLEVASGARNIDHILTGTLLPELSTKFLTHLADNKQIHSVYIDIGEAGYFSYEIN